MDSKQQQLDPFLFIFHGFDIVYSVNLNHLLEEDIQIVFRHKTNKQPASGNPYPVGMGLFVHNSKFHFFGGETITVDTDGSPKKLENKKVFSFTPNFEPDGPALNLESITEEEDNNSDSSTPQIPHLSSYSMKPIVFTFSDRKYALATKPFDGSLIKTGIKEFEHDVFEVFERNNDGKLQWTKLPDPPLGYLECSSSEEISMRYGIIPSGLPLPIYHCVIKNQLLLQTPTGEFIFDLIHRQWFEMRFEEHDMILASLEYKDQLLLFHDDGHLVAYDLKSFQEYKEDAYFWKQSFGAIWKKTIFVSGYIAVRAATLSIVDDNYICLVFNSSTNLYVRLLEFTSEVVVKASKKICLPDDMFDGPYTLSSFILRGPRREPRSREPRREGDVGKSNQDSTTTGTVCFLTQMHGMDSVHQIPYEEEVEELTEDRKQLMFQNYWASWEEG